MIYKFSKETTGWTQDNKPNTRSVLSATKNIDISDGVPKLAKRMTAFKSVSQSGAEFDRCSNIGLGFSSTSVPMLYYGTTDQLHYSTPDLTAVTKENTSGYGAGSSGIGVFVIWWDGYLWTSQGSSISRLTYATGTWTSGINSLSYSVNHPMCISTANTLCIADKFQVATRTTAGTFTGSKMVLPSFYEITYMISDNTRVYIGTRNLTGGKSKMFIWDGTSSTYTSEHIFDDPVAVWGVIRDGVLFSISGSGRLKRFNGLGFDDVAGLPYSFDKNITLYYSHGLNIGSPSSMCLSDNGIYVSINNAMYNGRSSTSKRAASQADCLGIYEYIEGQGLNHKYAINYSSDFSAPVDFGHAGIGVSYTHAIFSLNRSTSSGFLNMNAYGSKGNDVILTGNPNGDNTVSSYYVACAPTNGRNIGYMVTKRIYPDSQNETFQKIVIKYRNLYSANSSIKLKYRTKLKNGLPINTNVSSWSSNTVYTSTATEHQYVSAGDEFTLLHGYGAGKITTISSISESLGTYTVTLTDDIRGSTAPDSGYHMIDYWESIPMGTLTGSSSMTGVWEVDIPNKNQGGFIEIKVILDGDEEITIDEIVVITSSNKDYK